MIPASTKRRSALAAVLAAALASPAALSDTIFGLYAGANLWQPEANGTIGQSENSFDFSGEFAGGDSDSTSIYLAVEHFVPLIPNVLVRNTPVNWTGRSESASGTLGGLITLSGEVDAELDVDMKDATLYYELLDNWVTVDVGLTARMLDGFIRATETSTSQSDEVELSNTIPMLYGHVRVDLPFTGLAAGIRGNGIGYQESELLDLEAYLHLEVDLLPAVDFGIQGGLRRLSIGIEDLDDWNSDATLEGAYVGVIAHF
jgi:outer membrane protein